MAEKQLIEDIAQELIENSKAIESETKTIKTKQQTGCKKAEKNENKVFCKFRIKDIVFLAIMAAVTLVTSAIMPLVTSVPVFGIIQLCLGLQFSVFSTIGLMKVRKTGALIFMALCSGALLVFMFPPMFFCIVICAIITEGLNLIIFRGFKKDISCLFTGAIYFPCTLPFLYFFYKFIYTFTGEEGQAVQAYLGSSAGIVIGISIAVIAVCIVGAIIGMLISKELRKSGVMKK